MPWKNKKGMTPFGLHYSVLLTIVIANVVVIALAVLWIQFMLDEPGFLLQNWSKKMQVYKQYTTVAETQAATLVRPRSVGVVGAERVLPLPTTGYVKHILSSKVTQLPTYTYDAQFLKDHNISIGTPFTLEYTYNPATAVDLWTEDSSMGVYRFDGPVRFTAGTLSMNASGFYIYVGHDVSDGTYSNVDFYRIKVDPFTYEKNEIQYVFDLMIGSNDRFTSDALPEVFDPAAFSSLTLSGIEANSIDGIGLSWGFAGSVLKHTSAPELSLTTK